MTPEDLKERTQQFALRILKVVDALPKTTVGFVIGRQLAKAATSVAANYRSACRARSAADFTSKITVVEEETDECAFWMELIVKSRMLPEKKLHDLLGEADELTRIFVASGKTSKRKSGKRQAIPKSPIRNQQ